jgi:hypothetical protein
MKIEFQQVSLINRGSLIYVDDAVLRPSAVFRNCRMSRKVFHLELILCLRIRVRGRKIDEPANKPSNASITMRARNFLFRRLLLHLFLINPKTE